MAAGRSSPKNLHHVESEVAFKAITDEHFADLVVVDFFAEWCGPCKMFAPQFESMAMKHKTVTFVKVDADKCNALAGKFGVRALPTIVFLLKGAKADSVRGADAKAVEAAIVKLKPAGGVALEWGPAGGSDSPAASPAGPSFVPYAALPPTERAKADSVVAVCGCTPQVAAAMVQKHKGDVDSATMEVLTSRAGAEAFAREHISVSSTGSLSGHAAAAATAALGSGPGDAPDHAATPNPAGGATLQFRLGGRPSMRIKETFDKSTTVKAVAGFLVTKLPAGATFTLFTRKGATEVPLDMAATLEAAGLAPRGLVMVNDCAAPSFL